MFVARIDLLTRFELFLRRKNLPPLRVAQATHYSRQHVLRIRADQASPTRRFVLEVTAACCALANEDIAAGVLFERGDELVASGRRRLREFFTADLGVLDGLLADVSAETWPARVISAAVGSETAVRYLLRAGALRIDRAPREAVAIFQAAAAMASALPDTAPELAASLEAHGLKGRANALRHLGEFDAALSDLAAAARLFGDARYCTNEAGEVEYTRGTVLFKMERWADADAAARRARALFVATGDARRAAYAELLRAAVLFERGDVETAREIWLRLMSILSDLEDHETLARVWQNLASCEIRRRNAVDARQWILRAAAVFRALGNRTELVRTHWNMARWIASFRDPLAGIRLLERVEDAFAALGALADAGCVGLEVVERMNDAGASNAALTRHAQEVAAVLVSAGLEVSAADALAQLRRIAHAANRHAVLDDLRTAIRRLNGPCRPPDREKPYVSNAADGPPG